MSAVRKVNIEKDKLIVISTSNYFQKEIEENLKSIYIKLPDDKFISNNQALLKQQQLIIEKIISHYQPNIIITTARRIGKTAPKLILQKTLNILEKNSIIMDLTASIGGNTSATIFDKNITTNKGVLVCNKSNYPSIKAKESSISYAKCLEQIIQQKIKENI